MPLQFGDIYALDNFNSDFSELKERIESFINLYKSASNEKRYVVPVNKLMRICLLIGLSIKDERSKVNVENI